MESNFAKWIKIHTTIFYQREYFALYQTLIVKRFWKKRILKTNPTETKYTFEFCFWIILSFMHYFK